MHDSPQHPFARWLVRVDARSWASLATGVAGFAVAPSIGIASPLGIALLAGAFLLGGYGGSRVTRPRRRFPVRALLFEHVYRLAGVRGAISTCSSSLFVKASQAEVESSVHSKRRASGVIDPLRIKYRNLGPDGRKVTVPPPFIALSRAHYIEIPDASGEVTLVIRPPAPARKHDVLEVVIDETARDCFPADDEHVEKEVIFPIDLLALSIELSGCTAGNLMGTKNELGLLAGSDPLSAVTVDGIARIDWRTPNAAPGESYRLSWRWE